MSLLRDDAGRSCADRRALAALTPARVAGPVLATVALVGLAVVASIMFGLGTSGAVAAACVVAIVAAIGFRHTAGSLLAGAALRVARPYSAGEQVRLFVPREGREGAVVEAQVLRVGGANTTLLTEDGLTVVPNSRMLRAAPECANRPAG